MKTTIAFLGVLLTSATAFAQCPPSATRIINSGEVYSYDLGAVANTASEIRIDESLSSDFHELVRSTTWTRASGKPLPTFIHFSAAYHVVYYRVSAFGANGGCTSSGEAVFFEDDATIRRFRRTIVPVVGSLNGANGSRFRTSIVLLNPFDTMLTGRLVFHPVQTSGVDQSLQYRVAPNEHIEYEDVVVAIGASGLGSLDIVPDEQYVPAAQVTVVNDPGNGATFGMSIPQIRAGDIESNAGEFAFVVPKRSAQRLNVGVRSGADGGSFEAIVRSANGKTATVRRDIPADYLIHTTIEDLLGIPVADGDSVRFLPSNVVVYATLTNNITNDPLILVPFANASDLDVGYFR